MESRYMMIRDRMILYHVSEGGGGIRIGCPMLKFDA